MYRCLFFILSTEADYFAFLFYRSGIHHRLAATFADYRPMYSSRWWQLDNSLPDIEQLFQRVIQQAVQFFLSPTGGKFFIFFCRSASFDLLVDGLSLIHISEPTRLGMISYAVFCLK